MISRQRPRLIHVTLQDVARLAGVSTKTVSRVVNNQGEISDATRERVQAAIEQLAYRPNILARSLVNRRSNTLAVVAWGIDYYGPSRTVVGIEQQSDEFGYSLFLKLVARPDDAQVDRLLDELIARRVDGIIWAAPEAGENRGWLNPAILAQLPPIVFLSMAPRPDLVIVAVQNRSGAFEAVRHLLDQGRQRIGQIAGPLAWWEARERYAGCEEALTQAGRPARTSLSVEGDWSAASGDRALRALLAREPGLDAIFVGSDQMALGALGAAHSLGRRVPDDLAFVGFDDIPESAFFWPPLSTVRQPLIDAGRIAVKTLNQIIGGKWQHRADPDPSLTLIKPELVIRASSRVA
jgi:DNA-binding LacI/PurR family transcriptional regulator